MAVASPVMWNTLAIGAAVVTARAAYRAAVQLVVTIGAVFRAIAAPVERNTDSAAAGVLVGSAGLAGAVLFIGEVTTVVVAVTLPFLFNATAVGAGEVSGGTRGWTTRCFVRVVGAVLVAVAPVGGGDATASAWELVRPAGAVFDSTGGVVSIEGHSRWTEAGTVCSANR